jgi:hypothetical protein
MSNMNRFFRLLLPALVLALLLGVGAGIALAGRSDNGEAGRENPIDDTLSSNDEEVTGTETGQQPGDFLTNGEGQPDTETPSFIGEEVELMESPESQGVSVFQRIAGSNFQPRDSDATFSYYGGGCMQRDSNVGDSWFTVDLQVPNGALLDFLRVYYYDNDATYNINSELWAFDSAGGTTMIAEADSSGTPGYSSAGSDFFEHTVDNLNETLVIVASIQGGVGNTLALCGIRVRYQYSLAANFLPAVLNVNTP